MLKTRNFYNDYYAEMQNKIIFKEETYYGEQWTESEE